jgi:hypothetical protein
MESLREVKWGVGWVRVREWMGRQSSFLNGRMVEHSWESGGGGESKIPEAERNECDVLLS